MTLLIWHSLCHNREKDKHSENEWSLQSKTIVKISPNVYSVQQKLCLRCSTKIMFILINKKLRSLAAPCEELSAFADFVQWYYLHFYCMLYLECTRCIKHITIEDAVKKPGCLWVWYYLHVVIGMYFVFQAEHNLGCCKKRRSQAACECEGRLPDLLLLLNLCMSRNAA